MMNSIFVAAGAGAGGCWRGDYFHEFQYAVGEAEFVIMKGLLRQVHRKKKWDQLRGDFVALVQDK